MNHRVIDLFREMHVPIMFFPTHRKLAKRLTTAILLAYLIRQFIYYRKEKIFDTDQDIMERTTLTENELRKAKKDLKQTTYLQIRREGANGRSHYVINYDVLEQEILTNRDFHDLLKEQSRTPLVCEFNETLLRERLKTRDTKSVSRVAVATDATVIDASQEGEETDQNKSPVSSNGKHIPDLDKHPRWTRMAERLATAVMETRKVKISARKISQWSRCFRLLHTEEGIDVKRMKTALIWYCAQLPHRKQDQFFPVVHSGPAFREKFEKIEGAIERDAIKKRQQQGEESFNQEQDDKSQMSSEELYARSRKVTSTEVMDENWVIDDD